MIDERVAMPPPRPVVIIKFDIFSFPSHINGRRVEKTKKSFCSPPSYKTFFNIPHFIHIFFIAETKVCDSQLFKRFHTYIFPLIAVMMSHTTRSPNV